MDASQVNEVVDKLAEKVGIAADKLQPLAEQAIREYQMSQIVGAVVAGVFLLLGLVLIAQCVRRLPRLLTECEEATSTRAQAQPATVATLSVILGIIGLFMSIITLVEGLACARRAVAPTYHCLRALMG